MLWALPSLAVPTRSPPIPPPGAAVRETMKANEPSGGRSFGHRTITGRNELMSDEAAAPAMPRIGDAAPAFTAVTTQGMINFPADYEGKWVILFSHPADFTPVCTSEFMTFATMQDEFLAIQHRVGG